MILVSACLLGENCKYTGGNNRSEAVLALLAEGEYVPFCPEQAGGLSTPRLPSEIRNGRVYSVQGDDMTDRFRLGAERALSLCRAEGVTRAILKEGSPSCGCHRIYDGSFTSRTIPGMGVTARLLAEHGIEIMSDEDL